MEDYKSAHIAWAIKHPDFVGESVIYCGKRDSYEDVLRALYSPLSKVGPTQAQAKSFYNVDLRSYEKQLEVMKHMYALVKTVPTESTWFITLNFNHQTWSISSCLKILESILKFDWVIACRAVFELHRKNGEHPHIHMLLKYSPEKPKENNKSKLLEKLWAVKDIKKVILNKNFIDVDPGFDYHIQYINGDKIEEKMKGVALDREWRFANGIPHLFEK